MYKQELKIFAFFQMLTAICLFAQPFSGGDGSSINPYQVSSASELNDVRNYRSSYFIQTADIDLTGYNNGDGFGWEPICGDPDKFIGSYDGNGFKISNLTINRSASDNIGLFGWTNNAAIKNVLLISVDVHGKDYVGALIGMSETTLVINSGVTGIVDGNSTVGGLIGYASIPIISDSYSEADVTGNLKLGGFLGEGSGRSGPAKIAKCFASGNILGGQIVGGFSGALEAYVKENFLINDCYASGNSSGSTSIGGFGGNIDKIIITDCYSIGLVYGNSNVGGLVGSQANPNSINNCFWDLETSNQVSSDGGISKTTIQMKTLTTFTNAGWDFEFEIDNGIENIWDMDPNGIVNNGYPFLSWENGNTTALPVELTSFTANSSQNGVILNWKTATEVNNYGFEIEKSQRSNAKIEKWEKIGFVGGHGNSNSPKEYSFIDLDKLDGTIKYRLKQIDINGKFEYSDIVEIQIESPKEYKLSQNYPNPFNPSTVIKYGIPEQSNVKIEIFNMLGQSVGVLVNSDKPAGYHETTWNATNLPSGIYFVRISANSINGKNNFISVKKMILIK